MKLYIQGDVLLASVEGIPKDAELDKSIIVGDRIIIAQGGSTAHTHSLDAAKGKAYKFGASRFIHIKKKDEISDSRWTGKTPHGHPPISVPRGKYKIVNQKEHTPKEIVRAYD